MADKWKVNDGTQVDVKGKMYVGGDTFTATEDEVDEYGSRPYVSKVRQQAAPTADNKAQAAPKPQTQAKDNDRKS